jgi:hypothetical protein
MVSGKIEAFLQETAPEYDGMVWAGHWWTEGKDSLRRSMLGLEGHGISLRSAIPLHVVCSTLRLCAGKKTFFTMVVPIEISAYETCAWMEGVCVRAQVPAEQEMEQRTVQVDGIRSADEAEAVMTAWLAKTP